MGALWDYIDPGRQGLKPNALALWTPTESHSYGEVASTVQGVRQQLVLLGVSSGSRVLFMADRDAESVFLMLALASLECTLIAVALDYPVDRLLGDVAATRSDYCLVSTSFWSKNLAGLDGLAFLGSVGHHLTLLQTLNVETGTPTLGRDGRPLALIARSSGSTGAPKYVCLSQGAKVARLESHITTYRLEDKAVLLASTPLQHTLSQRAIYSALALGSTVAILDRYSPSRWRECALASGAEFSAVVASQMRTILAEGPLRETDGFRIKTLVSSSAPLNSEEKLAFVQQCEFDIHECYGTSEMATATDICLSANLASVTSVGWPVRGARVTVVDMSSGLELTVGKRGEVRIQSLQAFDGYLDSRGELATRWALGDDFRTGDLGEISGNGSLTFLGRTVEMINVGGSNVYPIEIETVGALFPGVHEVVAAGLPHRTLGEVPILFLRTGPSFEGVPQIMRFLRKRLEAFQLPQEIHIVREFPLTEAGKTDRKALLAWRSTQLT